MGKTKEQEPGVEKVSREKRHDIWEAIFNLSGVKRKVETKEAKRPLVERVLARWFKPSEDVAANTVRMKHEMSCFSLEVDYYKGEAVCLWIDLSELVLGDDNSLAGYGGVFIRKGEAKDGLALAFNDKNEASSLTLAQAEVLLALLTPLETSRSE